MSVTRRGKRSRNPSNLDCKYWAVPLSKLSWQRKTNYLFHQDVDSWHFAEVSTLELTADYRGAARMRPKRPCPPEKTEDFSLVFYINLNCSNTNERNSRTHVVSCSLTDQGLAWLYAIGCGTIRLKHATLLAKLPISADNTSWGVAWMNRKGAAFLQRSTNSDETFLRGLFAQSIAEPDRNILGQDMINSKRTTQRSVMQQRSVSHSTVGIMASGYAKPGRRDSILKCRLQQVTVSAAHKLC